MSLGALFLSLAAFFVAAASPGPATLAVMTVAMSRGRSQALVFASGLSAGLAVWGVVAAVGLGTLMLQFAFAMQVIKVLGGLFLLYLAIQSARSALSESVSERQVVSQHGLFKRGVLLNLLNPKALLAWLAVISVGLPSGAGLGQVVVVTLSCSVLGWLIYAAYAALFSLTASRGVYARGRRWFEGAFALLFGAAGLRVLTARTA